jgi:hypothetical protein
MDTQDINVVEHHPLPQLMREPGAIEGIQAFFETRAPRG